MNWKEQLSEIEKDFGYHKNRDWKPAIKSVNNLLTEYPTDVELNIRAIYTLHNILVEEEYPDEELDKMIALLQAWFNQSKEDFSDNAEYLFFIGKILHIAEWYFGLEDSKLALEFQKKAMEKEPGNLLYEWAYRFSCPGDIVVGYLAHQLITNEKDKVRWLKSKGFPGEYILEHLETSNREYLETKASQ
jgi:tetratricopeptide (TPR) repeat protein